MKNTYLLHLLIFLFSFQALADSKSQFIQDGTTEATIQRALASNLIGRNLTITEYTKSWISYNPMNWVIDGNSIYRNITFEFTSKKGEKLEYSCKARMKKDTTDFMIYNCSGGDGRLVYHNRLNQYGYVEDTIIMDNVITRNNQGTDGNSTRATQ
jgi:hypothetical protein